MENLKKGDWAMTKIEADKNERPYIIYRVIELQNNGKVRVFGYDKNNKFAGEYICSQQTLELMEQTVRRCMVCRKEVMYLYALPDNPDSYMVTFVIYLDCMELPLGKEYRCKKHPAIFNKEDAKKVTASQIKKLNRILEKYKKRILNVCISAEGNLIVDIKRAEVAKHIYPYARLNFSRHGAWIDRDTAKGYDYKKKELQGEISSSIDNVNRD